MGYEDERPDSYRGLTRRDLDSPRSSRWRGTLVLATGGLGIESARAASFAPVVPKRGGTLRVAVTGLAASQDQLEVSLRAVQGGF